jgi:hypothetical protein
MPLRDRLPLISSALGFIAIVCVLAIGGYIIAWCWNIYSSGLGPSFLTITIISWVLILTSALLLAYGSLKTIKKSTLKGGLINLTAGIEIIPMFIYFYSYFPLLPQFGFLGFLMFVPAMLSGIIGLASPKRCRA